MNKTVVKDCRNCINGKYNDHYGISFCYESDNCVNWNLWEPSDLLFIEPEQKENKSKEIKDALEQLNLGPEQDVTVEYDDAVDVAIEALELQIPNEWGTEKFNPSYFSYTEPKIVYVCTDCKGITDNAYKYCPHCGKAKIIKDL